MRSSSAAASQTREVVADPALMAQLRLDPSRQLIAAQCSGTLVLAKLGLLDGVPACTDLTTKPWVVEAGVEVLNQPFVAKGNVATAGGCLASQYLAAWIIARLEGVDAAGARCTTSRRWARRRTTSRARCATSPPISTTSWPLPRRDPQAKRPRMPVAKPAPHGRTRGGRGRCPDGERVT